MGEDNMIKFGSIPELFYILEETKPYIVHMLTDIDMETNLANSIRGKAKHFKMYITFVLGMTSI